MRICSNEVDFIIKKEESYESWTSLDKSGDRGQVAKTEKSNERSVMLESLKRVRVIQSVKIRLSSRLTGKASSEQGWLQ